MTGENEVALDEILILQEQLKYDSNFKTQGFSTQDSQPQNE